MFNTVGVENITYQDAVACFVSFAVVLLGSLLIGIVIGFAAGLVFHFTSHISVIEPLVVFVFGYMSFFLTEIFHLSGIMSYVTFALVISVFKNIVA